MTIYINPIDPDATDDPISVSLTLRNTSWKYDPYLDRSFRTYYGYLSYLVTKDGDRGWALQFLKATSQSKFNSLEKRCKYFYVEGLDEIMAKLVKAVIKQSPLIRDYLTSHPVVVRSHAPVEELSPKEKRWLTTIENAIAGL